MAAILMVEDDRLLGREMKIALEKAEHTVWWTQNGDEAMEVLRTEKIQLVFLDIMLLGSMDGYEILKRIKGEAQWDEIPVVMVSNLGQMEEINRAMELGAVDYVVKANIDLDQLVE